jgi:hypothetical protein
VRLLLLLLVWFHPSWGWVRAWNIMDMASYILQVSVCHTQWVCAGVVQQHVLAAEHFGRNKCSMTARVCGMVLNTARTHRETHAALAVVL